MLKRRIIATLIPLAVLLCSLTAFVACSSGTPETIDKGTGSQVSGGTQTGGDPAPDETPPTETDDGDPDESEGDGKPSESGSPTVTPSTTPPAYSPSPAPALHLHQPAHTPEVKSTCTEAGNVEYWYCAGCDKYFSDEVCLTEIASSDIETEPKGHSPVMDTAVIANCVNAGLTEGSHCGDCNEVLVAQLETELTAHVYEGGKCLTCNGWEESAGLDYEETDGGLALTGLGSCAAEYILVPATHGGKPVVRVEGFAFSCCENIKGIRLPDTVTEIGDCAFENCVNLEEVYLGDGVTATGFSAFSGCTELKTVVLSTSLKSLETQVFDGCTALKELYIPASVEKICVFALNGCANLKTLTVCKGLAGIEYGAFEGCALEEIIFLGTEEEWAAVDNSAGGNYTVKFGKD